jgi:hypothetical protein
VFGDQRASIAACSAGEEATGSNGLPSSRSVRTSGAPSTWPKPASASGPTPVFGTGLWFAGAVAIGTSSATDSVAAAAIFCSRPGE